MKPQHALFGLGLLLSAACNPTIQSFESNDSKNEIKPDYDWTFYLENKEERLEIFTVSCSKSSVFTTKKGSTLHVPENCFVDADGKPILGDINLHWEEYHTLGDQILSDINMMYDSAGVSAPFISGGMFKIDGSQRGKQVFIAKDKEIKVDLMSEHEFKNFNFYQQDQNSTQWTYKMNANATPAQPIQVAEVVKENEIKQKRSNQIIDAKPKNLKDFPELKSLNIMGWETPDKVDASMKSKIRSENTKCELEENENNQYTLVFKLEDGDFRIRVTPFTFEDAENETLLNKREMEKEKKNIAERQQEAQKVQYIRSASVSSFATYNWDVRNSMTKPKEIFANFKSKTGIDQEDDLHCTLVSLSKGYQVKFSSKLSGTFPIDANDKNTILAINLKGEIFFVDPKELEYFSKNGMKITDSFGLINSGMIVQSPRDIDNVIKSLMSA